MKTVLFAWELGAGSGHLTSIRRLALRLRAHDVRLVAAVTRLDSISILDGVISEIHRMPNWRVGAAARTGEVRSSATLNDILVNAGFADAALVQRTTGAWERLFRSLNPSLVIADFAPAAALAARGRIPLLMTGNGYALPPHDMETFPPLHAFNAPVHHEAHTLASVNAAARRLGLRALDRLPQLFDGDAHLVRTLPLLDPYAHLRHRPADGPVIDTMPRARLADAKRIFVYISQGVEVRSDVVAALRPVADAVCIHAPMLRADAEANLARGGARIEREPVDLSQALPECRLVVHLGGNGLAAEALLAGIPQLALATHVEQYLTGVALEQAGIGRLFMAHDPARAFPADTIEAMVRDEVMAERAAAAGSLHRDRSAKDSAFKVFDRACERLLG